MALDRARKRADIVDATGLPVFDAVAKTLAPLAEAKAREEEDPSLRALEQLLAQWKLDDQWASTRRGGAGGGAEEEKAQAGWRWKEKTKEEASTPCVLLEDTGSRYGIAVGPDVAWSEEASGVFGCTVQSCTVPS